MEETSTHILCECEALASLIHAHLGSFYLEPKDIQSISLGAIWSFSKCSGLPWLDMGHKGPALRPRFIGGERSRTLDILILIHKKQPLHYSTRRITVQNAIPTNFKIHFNIILPLTLKSRMQSLPLGFSDQNFARFFINPTLGIRLVQFPLFW